MLPDEEKLPEKPEEFEGSDEEWAEYVRMMEEAERDEMHSLIF